MRIRIKVCCISSVAEAQIAIAAGADALGLVTGMPSGPGVIDDRLAREISSVVPPAVATFLLTSSENGDEIVEHVEYCGTNTVQIVRHLDPQEYSTIIKRLPYTKRVQVVHVEGDGALELIEAYEPFVDAFLLDSGKPGAATAELGGTGRSHDWTISSEFVRRTCKPVFLAGGLTADNAPAAIESVRPFGLDLCSSVRTDDHLDEEELARFMAAVSHS